MEDRLLQMDELAYGLQRYRQSIAPHGFSKDGKKQLKFVAAGRGHLAARGAPNPATITMWKSVGATAVVTLQNENEAADSISRVQRRCAELGLQWLHLPLSGKSAVTNPQPSDMDAASLRRVAEVAALLQHGESVVVHCAAGMHRTGVVCYLALRLVGQGEEEALASILASREVTHAEVTKVGSRHRPLYVLAEEKLERGEA